MVETILKSKNELVYDIAKLTVDEFSKDIGLIQFYRELCLLDDDIKRRASTELYEKFKTEKRCVYYESFLGNGQYTEHVIDDCINVLNEIIDSVIFSED